MLPPRDLPSEHRDASMSGSSLLQLCLNAHNDLYAGQELYLLMFDTMDERRATLGETDLEEGLLATVMCGLSVDAFALCSLRRVQKHSIAHTTPPAHPRMHTTNFYASVSGLCL